MKNSARVVNANTGKWNIWIKRFRDFYEYPKNSRGRDLRIKRFWFTVPIESLSFIKYSMLQPLKMWFWKFWKTQCFLFRFGMSEVGTLQVYLQQQQQYLQQQIQNLLLFQPNQSQTTALFLQSQVDTSNFLKGATITFWNRVWEK